MGVLEAVLRTLRLFSAFFGLSILMKPAITKSEIAEIARNAVRARGGRESQTRILDLAEIDFSLYQGRGRGFRRRKNYKN
jgi:hypothetical protein